jgi:hypothetical protein
MPFLLEQVVSAVYFSFSYCLDLFSVLVLLKFLLAQQSSLKVYH